MPFLRFLLVGLIGLGVDAGLFAQLLAAGAAEAAARVAALPPAIGVTWALNRRLTFGASDSRRRDELLRYIGVALAAQASNALTFLALRQALPSLPRPAAFLAASCFATLFSFFGQKHVTFRRRLPVER